MAAVRTGYSFRVAVGHTGEVISRLKEIGETVALIADRNSTFGFAEWRKQATDAGLRPAFGVEIGVAKNLEPVLVNGKKRPPPLDYWTFVAKNNIEDINKIVKKATQQFYYEPMISQDQALSFNDVNIITGQKTTNFPRDHENIFIGLGPRTPRGVYLAAKKARLKFALSWDNFFPRENDRSMYEAIIGKKAETSVDPQWIMSTTEFFDHLLSKGVDENDIQDAVENSKKIRELSTAKLMRAELLRPDDRPGLRFLAEKGAKEKGIDLEDPVYKERIDREILLIQEKNFDDYFYIVSDLVQWAKTKMLVGPARGSSAGSLLCYLLGITTIDPLKHGLIFERFIDINRSDLPDIDIDFSDSNRDLVFEYLGGKYGQDRVARLGTVARFKSRSTFGETSKSLSVPLHDVDVVMRSIMQRSSGDARALSTIEDVFETDSGRDFLSKHPSMSIATRIEGHPRHYSQHAAGVVLASQPISKFVAVDARTNATMCDKKDAEYEYNLLKIDILGLTQLSIFEDTLELVGLQKDFLETIPLDSQQAFNVLNEGKFSGVFQFIGDSAAIVTKQIKRIDKFEDIVNLTALSRPGPLASGSTREWFEVRNGLKKVTYQHPLLEDYLKDTLGVIIYQEQVMNIARNVGNLSWGDVNALRRAMSKSLGKEFFDQYGDPWKKAAIEKGMSEKEAADIWDSMCGYGSLGFNKSHAVAYGLISYWCCWLKAHYLLEFLAATLNHESDVEKQLKILRELDEEGITYVPFDISLSKEKWTVGNKDGKRFLVGPLSNAKGVGPKTVSAILSARSRIGERISADILKKFSNVKTDLDYLWPIKAATSRCCPSLINKGIISPVISVIDALDKPSGSVVVLIGTFAKIDVRDVNDLNAVARRGYEIKEGPMEQLNLRFADDTGIIFAVVNRHDFARLGKKIVEYGRPNKCIWAVKGKINEIGIGFKLLNVKMVRLIGDKESE